MPKIATGRIVRYVIRTLTDGRPVIRPAIIVRVWDETECNLQVFTDDDNDGETGTVYRRRVRYSEGAAEGTWHFPASVMRRAAELEAKEALEARTL